MTEAEYWNNLRGEDYNAMFAGKYQHEHALQEQFLSSLVWELNGNDRMPKILEVGCGPGRLAKVLASKCHYTGFDRSLEMSRPLRELIDAGLEAEFTCWIKRRERYAAAFTCSVLIHNPPEHARSAISVMCDIAERVWLIENKRHFGASEKQSEEHGGCWVHDYDSFVPPGWKMTVESLCRTHDVYVLEKA